MTKSFTNSSAFKSEFSNDKDPYQFVAGKKESKNKFLSSVEL
jgi:hypothetical protein